jgi:amino-acid N-acetyltransferase
VKASLTPDLLAVELADSLVAEGMPFREAHALVGRLWSEAERLGTTPSELPEAMRVAISPLLTSGRLEDLDYAKSLERRNHSPGAGPRAVAEQLGRAEARLGMGAGDGLPRAGFTKLAEGDDPTPRSTVITPVTTVATNGHVMRRADLSDVPAIARLMADFVAQGVLLPRPVGELYQCIREFHVATIGGEVVACGALRLLWGDLGEVRSLAVRPDQRGKGMGAAIVDAVVADARSLGLPRVIALTREVPFFESCGFTQATRESLPRKVWTDCVQCPRRHACDEVAMVLDL